MIGIRLDSGTKDSRHKSWRPTIALMKQDIKFHRLELWYQPGERQSTIVKKTLAEDLRALDPKASIIFNPLTFSNPWDFEEVYLRFYNFAKNYPWKFDSEDYYLHISTGTHVMQVCYFALSEANIMPCKLFQTGDDDHLNKRNQSLLQDYKSQIKSWKSSDKKGRRPKEPAYFDRSTGIYQIIDLKSERYSKISQRFQEERKSNQEILKSGIDTKNPSYNAMITEIEMVAQLSSEPMLLTGETGVGKTHLARKIYELKSRATREQHRVKGPYIEINCATLRGDMAMSTLFGHKKGAFTGATSDRDGLMKKADGGVLFLDEVGELGLDEQAMLLKSIEDKTFLPVGGETYEKSDFILICGTNRQLHRSKDKFRSDLLARLSTWEFELPPLHKRKEDIGPNIDFELQQFSIESGKILRFSKEAAQTYHSFAQSAPWTSNFRDLRSSILRLCTLSQDQVQIEEATVRREIAKLEAKWSSEDCPEEATKGLRLEEYVGSPETLNSMTPLEKHEISFVLSTIKNQGMKEAAKALFAGKQNPSDRLRKKLLRYDIDPKELYSTKQQ